MAAFSVPVTLRRYERFGKFGGGGCLFTQYTNAGKKKKKNNETREKNKERINMNFRRRYGLLPPSFRWEERILFHGITLWWSVSGPSSLLVAASWFFYYIIYIYILYTRFIIIILLKRVYNTMLSKNGNILKYYCTLRPLLVHKFIGKPMPVYWPFIILYTDKYHGYVWSFYVYVNVEFKKYYVCDI